MLKKQIPITLGILIIILVAGIAGASIFLFNQKEDVGKTNTKKEDVFETDEIVEDNYLNLGEAKADGYYIEQLVDFYPTLLEEAINNSNLSLLENFFGNEEVAREHEKLIEALQQKGTNFKVDNFIFLEDYFGGWPYTIYQKQEVEIFLSYTSNNKEKEQIILNYFFKFDEHKDDSGEGRAVIVEMTEKEKIQ